MLKILLFPLSKSTQKTNLTRVLEELKYNCMEKELENRLTKIEEVVGIIKIDVQEGFRETRGKLSKLETRLNDTYNAVDGFIKIVTKLEDEFAAMKADIKRVKEVIKEKLGVDLF